MQQVVKGNTLICKMESICTYERPIEYVLNVWEGG